jgi:hypothetical protein
MKDRLASLLSEAEGLVNNDLPTVEQIADYLLDNGVIAPPCKVGDTVYWYNMGGEIAEAKVKMLGFAVRHSKGFEYDVPFDAFGKTVFLTREEAEKALAERSGE